MKVDMLRSARWLLLILLVALVLRLGYVLSLAPTIQSYDGKEYDRLAHCLIENNAYLTRDGAPTAYWPPGYPVVLAILNRGVTGTRVVQAIMGALAILLGYGIARHFHGKTESLLAAAILAFYPLYVYAAGTYYPVILQTLLLAAIFWLLLHASEEASALKVFFAGLLGAAATLTAPSILPALGFALLWLLREGGGRRGLRLAILFLIPLLLIVGSWTVSNYRHFDRPILVSLNGGYNFWLGNFPGTKATTGNREIPGRHEEESSLVAAFPDEAELDLAFFRKGTEHIRADPGRFVVLSLSKALNLWRLYPAPMTHAVSLEKKLLSILSYGLPLLFGLCWLFRNLCRSPGARLVLLFFLSYTLVHAVFISKVRFRLPLDTLLIVMAVGGLGDLARRLGWKSLGRPGRPGM